LFLDRSAWISDRYFVFPLDSDRMNRFVLCDVRAADDRLK
jgi:hypothetical protein